MGIAKVNPVEERIDILVDEHPRLLIAGTMTIIVVVCVIYYYLSWPIIGGQPEYVTRPVLQSPTIEYEVLVTLPKRVEPRGDGWYELTMDIRQTQVLTATQAITSGIHSLSRFAKFASSTSITSTNALFKESEKSFDVLPLTPHPQEFPHVVYLRTVRPANRTETLPLQLSLAYGNVRYSQVVSLPIDYWSRMVVSIVSGGTLVGILTFVTTILRSGWSGRVRGQKVLGEHER